MLFVKEQDFNLRSEATMQGIQVMRYILHQDLIQFIFPDEGTIQEIILN